MTSHLTKYALLLTCVGLLSACSKSPESTVDSFYRALAKGEITEAKGYISQQILGMMGDAKLGATLIKEAEKIKKCGGIKTVESSLTRQGEIESGKTIVTFGGDCPQRAEKAKLIKENGHWKLTAAK